MKLYALLILLHYTPAQCSNDEKCAIDNRSEETMWEYKLVNYLKKCGYDMFKAPTPNGTERLEVHLHFRLKKFKFNSELQEFTVSTKPTLVWTDNRLSWDPSKYDNLKSINAGMGSIWTPSIRLLNDIEEDWSSRYIFIPCQLEYTGLVRCFASIDFKVKCATDLRDWPYDAQSCSLVFGLYSETGTKMDMNVPSRAFSMIGSEYGTDWDIMDYEQVLTNHTSEQQLTAKFRLERHAESLAAIVIYPTLIVTTLTFSSLFIDPSLNLRLVFICFSLFCHNYFITDLTFEIPPNTKNPPRLLMYYKGSLILTWILIFVSFVLNGFSKSKNVCPIWIISINNFVFTNVVKFIIWPRWKTEKKDNIDGSNTTKEWVDLINIANTVCIFTAIVAYVILYKMFIPHPIPFI